MAQNCEICGVECEERHSFRYPDSNNQDTTKYICKECHQSIRLIINDFMDSIETSNVKKDNFYPVIYPNKMNNETTKYIEYNNYKSLEKEINKFIDNGGI